MIPPHGVPGTGVQARGGQDVLAGTSGQGRRQIPADDRAGDQERPTFPPAAPMTAATRSIRPNWPRVFTLAGHDPGPMKQSVPPNGAEASPAISVGEAESLDARIAEQAETIRNLWQRLDAADQRVAAEVEERR